MAAAKRFFFSKTDLHLELARVNSPRSLAGHLQNTEFDRQLQEAWSSHVKQGHFRYELASGTPESRVLSSSSSGDHRFGFVAQLNPMRASQRRPPQAMLHTKQAFCANKFNFTKIDEQKETIFELQQMESPSAANERHLVVINVSPLEFGHCLLVPRLEACLPQVLTEESIALAASAVLLSGARSFKAAFNSLCAFASVNHLHWHLYYLQGHALRLESVPVHKLAGPCYTVSDCDYPAPCFAFEVRRREDIEPVAAAVFKLTDFLSNADVAHNVFITRGADFSGADKDSIKALRILVWAREKVVGSKDPGAFVIAVCELAGQILVYDEEKYRVLTEEDVAQAQRDAVANTFQALKPKVQAFFQSKGV